MFEYRINPFKGVSVSPNSLPDTVQQFEEALSAAITRWKEEGLMTVWLEVPTDKSALIPAAVAQGFQFHHCQADYLMLAYQLVPGAFIPPYATHYAGAGGVVLNKKRELLVVVEQQDRVKRPNYYKLPGGMLNIGEHIADGVIREVLEETGVQTRFDSLVCFRQWHDTRHGKSDFYFVCRLLPIEETITIQESEIAKCMWMPVDDFLNHASVGTFSKGIVATALRGEGLVPGWFDGYNQDKQLREIFIS